MSTNKEWVHARSPASSRIIGPLPGGSALAGEFSYEAGVARGFVRYSAQCRDVLMVDETVEEWTTIKPDYGSAVVGVVAGGMLGVGSGALVAHAPDFSNERSCSFDDDSGNEHCSSPREAALLLGITGVAVSLVAVAAGVGTFGRRSERRQGVSFAQPARVTKVRREGVTCGHGPIRGLGVALFRGDVLVSASVSNGVGVLSFSVPPWVTGELSAVVDSVPRSLSFVRRGDVLGTVSVPALPDPAL